MRFILTFAILAFASHGILGAVVGRQNKHVKRHRQDQDIYEWAKHERGYDGQNKQQLYDWFNGKGGGYGDPIDRYGYDTQNEQGGYDRPDYSVMKELPSSYGRHHFPSNQYPLTEDFEFNSDHHAWPSGGGIGPAFPRDHPFKQRSSNPIDKYRYYLAHHGFKWLCFNNPELYGVLTDNLDKNKISELIDFIFDIGTPGPGMKCKI
uniref:Uncharacterized protein n=1 Tax=Panagrolaimus sp. ES5 TaxID=591445 RepID=A0AC34GV23_9BILA